MAALSSAGCVDLGICDERSAEQVVFMHSLDPFSDGLPAYAGQAIVQRSCGNGAFCHSEDAIDRYGTPAGLALDLRIACPDPALCDDADLARLRRARGDIVALRADVWYQTSSGAMPPGEVGAGVASVGPRFRTEPARTEGVARLPAVDTTEGLAILRNWLACGAPAVEQTVAESDTATAGETCPDTATVFGRCVVRSGTGEAAP